MSTNLGHKSSGTEVFALEVILNAGYDDESTSESRHKLHISFCFSWLEDLAGEATKAWENCFFFLSTNVIAPSPGSILLAACNGELGNPKIAIEEAQHADEMAGMIQQRIRLMASSLQKVQRFTLAEQSL